jgi:predicted secreted protein
VSGQYVTFNKKVMETGSSSNANSKAVTIKPKGLRVAAASKASEAASEANKYSYRNNYKGKNPMTRTQW